jgi:hypothetical protein
MSPTLSTTLEELLASSELRLDRRQREDRNRLRRLRAARIRATRPSPFRASAPTQGRP